VESEVKGISRLSDEQKLLHSLNPRRDRSR